MISTVERPRLTLSKLRAKSAGEVAERLRYRAYCRRERGAHARGLLSSPDRLRLALTRTLTQLPNWADCLIANRAEGRTRFFPSASARAAVVDLFETEYRRERNAALDEADLVLKGNISFFGQRFEIGSTPAWHRDPVSGAEWPHVYHRDVPIHGGSKQFGDVKYVWELNRHQFLTDLGRAAFLTGDARYAAMARQIVCHWIAENPYGTGVNWACALEPAFRVFSWLWTYYLSFDFLLDQRNDHLTWLTGFYDHGRFLHRHLELHSSPYNHLIGEASALYVLGVLFPEFEESTAWRLRGRRVLESRLCAQFYPDGGSREQSTFYHHATLAFYVLAALIGKRNGEEFAPQVWAAIERGIAFSAALAQPDGRTPAIGGADDGKPLRMEHLPLWDFRPWQAIGAVLFGRADFKYVAGRFHEDALWLLGPEALRRFEQDACTPPASRSIALRDSGYYVMRSDWSRSADYVCVDCGEQAGDLRGDSVPNSVHGHADCLSVVVSLGGRPVLVDSGLYCYNGDPEWMSHFRRTAAHNTARIDGEDQARYLGKMAWSHSYTARPEHWSVDDRGVIFIGSHDGYARRGGDTIHRRLVWLRPERYVIVYDEFDCEREHDLELNFQFASGELRLMSPGVAAYRNSDILRFAWQGSIELAANVEHGGMSPDQGWIAPSLGVKEPAPRLQLKGRLAGRTSFLALIVSTEGTGIGIEPFSDQKHNRSQRFGFRIIGRINTAVGIEREHSAGTMLTIQDRHKTDTVKIAQTGRRR